MTLERRHRYNAAEMEREGVVGMVPEVERWREQIDQIDQQIVHLLNERARLALKIGEAKSNADARVFVPDREHQVLQNVLGANPGPLQGDHLRAIYREILSACRGLQRPLRIAYLGPRATFTHQAALDKFGEANEFVPVPSIPDIFLETQRGGADYGVVPVENSTEGPVHETLDMFVDTEVKVCAAVTLPIVHYLLGHESKDQVRTVYSNPQAAAQCRRWLAQHLPGREIVHAVSTARAAEMAAGDPHGAAIATRLAAEVYGLRVLEGGIQDMASNYTRFFVIAPSMTSQPSGQDRTAILFSIKDRVGALHDVVEVFAARRINLRSIQSRPSRRRAWDYVFFVEMEGHPAEPRVAEALALVEQQCVFLKVLGAYPVD